MRKKTVASVLAETDTEHVSDYFHKNFSPDMISWEGDDMPEPVLKWHNDDVAKAVIYYLNSLNFFISPLHKSRKLVLVGMIDDVQCFEIPIKELIPGIRACDKDPTSYYHEDENEEERDEMVKNFAKLVAPKPGWENR